MRDITQTEIERRLTFDNPWWEERAVDARFREWPKRSYFQGFVKLLEQETVKRAVVLMGPRRVGKTVIIHQAIQQLIDGKVSPVEILYVSVDTPVYTGLSLERLFNLFRDAHGHDRNARLYVFFDEIQYLPEWERHLKSLVDSFPSVKFVASGSAAAALKMKSRESGAGRFTEFLLPPLSFSEFLKFRADKSDWQAGFSDGGKPDRLNSVFIDYINFGGFPEAVLDADIRRSMDRYIANDIVDKVLLRDLPSLYGIADSQELKRFFAVLTYNTGNEVSMDGLSKASGVAKNTIRKYLDYLEAAFLIHRLYRVDENARRFKRNTFFKVYLTNPSFRAALFEPVGEDDEAMGALAETAIVAQIAQTNWLDSFCYARWKQGRQEGEVDLVVVDSRQQKAKLAIELKWTDRAVDRPDRELAGLFHFCRSNGIAFATVGTRSRKAHYETDGLNIEFIPMALLCLGFGVVPELVLSSGVHPASGELFGDRQQVSSAMEERIRTILESNSGVLRVEARNEEEEAAYRKILGKVPDRPPLEGDEIE